MGHHSVKLGAAERRWHNLVTMWGSDREILSEYRSENVVSK